MKWIEILNTNSIYHITLSRPEVRNAFNPEMIQEITQAFRQIPADTRMVVLRGKGKVFCSGADLEWMKSMVNFSLEKNRTDSLELYDMFQAMKSCVVPILTLVQGAAMGGALGLMACSDIVLAEKDTQFCFSEVKLGLVPAVISSFVLEKSNLGHIAPWMIAGKVFGVIEAQRFGLVHQTGSLEEMESSLTTWMQTLLDAAPGAVQDTKNLISTILKFKEEQIKEKTTSLIAARRVSEEGQEGLKSFLEKRSPAWKESLK